MISDRNKKQVRQNPEQIAAALVTFAPPTRMKKSLFLIVLIVGAVLQISAQAYQFYYHNTYKQQPAGYGSLLNDEPDDAGEDKGWSVLLDTGKTARLSKSVAIPFAFQFNSNSVTHFKVSTTGFLTFDTTVSGSPTGTAEKLPTSKLPDKTLAIWGIEGTGSNDKVLVKTFGTAPNRQFWIKYSSYSLPADTANSWIYVSLVLEESSNKLYVVMMAHNNAYGKVANPVLYPGVQVSASNGISDYDAVAPVFPMEFRNEDNVAWEFFKGSKSKLDAGIYATSWPDMVVANTNSFVYFNMVNSGTDTIKTLETQVELNHVKKSAFKWPLNEPANGKGGQIFFPEFKFDAPAGTYNILKIWVQKPNDSADGNAQNDTIVLKILSIQGTSGRYKPMLEYTTATWCGDCPELNYRMDQFKSRFDDSLVVVRHHLADAMSAGIDADLTSTFGQVNVASVDRYVNQKNQLISFLNSTVSDSLMNKYLHPIRQTPVEVSVSDIKLDTTAKTLTFKVLGTFKDYCIGRIRIGGIAMEDAMRGVGNGWDQQLSATSIANKKSPYYNTTNPIHSPYHNDVAVGLPGGLSGVLRDHGSMFSPNDTVSATFTYKIPALMVKTTVLTSPYYPIGDIYSKGKPMDMKAVGWIAVDHGNSSNYYILNANSQRLWDVTQGLKHPSAMEAVVYPNPTSGDITLLVPNGSYQIAVLSAAGAEVHNSSETSNGSINLHLPVAPGVYLLQATSAKGLVYHSRLVVQ